MTAFHWIMAMLVFLLLISTFGNLLLLRRIKKTHKNRRQTAELQDFLADLLSGQGIVSVNCIDPESILLRSPGRLK